MKKKKGLCAQSGDSEKVLLKPLSKRREICVQWDEYINAKITHV